MTNPLYDTLFAPHAGSVAPLLLAPDETEAVSYDAFLRKAGQMANALTKLGLTPRDRLVVQVAKSGTALALYAACVRAGIVYLPLNTAYTAVEVSYFLKDSGARVMICDKENHGALKPTALACNASLLTLNQDETGGLSDLAREQSDWFATVHRSVDDLAALLYTSGTTGKSKGAMLTHENLLSNARTLAEYWKFSKNDVLLHALPIFHTHGLFVATNTTLLAGGSMIFCPRFDLDQIIANLPHATSMMGVPTFYTRLLSDPRLDRNLVSHMRLFISGSAPLLSETHTAFHERTGHRILERYGMTETNMNTSNPYYGDRRPGTVGFPLPDVELKITDPASGEKLQPGEIGQIEVRGPNVFKGYWNMPAKTREELREDGFFITGDLGKIDQEGYVHIIGRNKDLIISGGYNIYPKEIEIVLDALPGVLESAVIGVPHADFGESVVAVIVTETGAEIAVDDIRKSIAHELAGFKLPRLIEKLDELPRNAMGKVQKNILRARFANFFKA